MTEELNQTDFCRICRCEGTSARPLFYPCLCTGSIKYIHQECLLRWLQYSKRHTCELCNHRFTFAPIYASDTPRFVPLSVLLSGFVSILRRCLITWLHFILVFIAWLVVVPLTACRIYRCLFTGSVTSLLTLPLDMLSTRHLLQDCVQGFAIVALALAAFLGYVSLREQLQQGGTPEWLQPDGQADDFGDQRADANLFPDPFNLFVAPAPAVPVPAPAPPAHSDGSQTPAVPGPQEDGSPSASVASTSALLPPPAVIVAGPSTSPGTAAGSSTNGPEAATASTPTVTAPQGSGDAVPPADAGENAGNVPNADGDGEEENGDGDAFDGAAGAFGDLMNWERLLGLDGSLAFLEHVLWLIALNTLFIVIFAFCPYHLGQFTVLGFKLEKFIAATHMEGISTSLIGYLIVAAGLILLHMLFKTFGMSRASYGSGLAYVYVKVALVSLLELGLFPVFCGFWIDACTLSVFNATMAHRLEVFHHAPLAFTLIHWATGMLYIFYMSSLLLLCRSVVRPGLLHCVYHFNDPDYRPVHDMIFGPLPIYIQRLVASYSIWGIIIVLMTWLPSELVRRLLPGFLPLQLTRAYEGPLDYSVEIVLFHFVLPFVLDERGKEAVRHLLRCWCLCVSWLLDLRSYLLGDVPFKAGDFIINEDGNAVPHQPTTSPSTSSEESRPTADQPRIAGSLLAAGGDPVDPPPPPAEGDVGGEGDEFVRYVPYLRPTGYFLLRCAGLLGFFLLTLVLISLCLLVVPLGVGRRLLLVITAYSNLVSGATEVSSENHDAVALIAGFTAVGVVLRLSTCLPTLLQACWRLLCSFVGQASARLTYWSESLRLWTRSGVVTFPALPAPAAPVESPASSNRTVSLLAVLWWTANYLLLSLLSFVYLLVIPVAIGLLFDLVFIVPFKVSPMKTLVFGVWEHWIFGIMHLKLFTLLTMIGPPWWLRNRINAIQQEILEQQHRVNSLHMLVLIAPFFVCVGLLLAVPYLGTYCLAHLYGFHFETVFRYIYPGFFVALLSLTLLAVLLKQLRKLYLHIKDERYLVGRKLINLRQQSPSTVSTDNTTLAAITTTTASG